jgi:endonuclease/exonuclease/phosphatase family metal-dependent hydrolase
MSLTRIGLLSLAWLLFGPLLTCPAADTFRVATYNLNNYLNAGAESRPVKTAESRSKIRQNLQALKADVVALQEMGTPEDLTELRQSLQADGSNYPHWEWVPGSDTNIHVAVISRFPIVARRPHTNESFLLYGRRFHVSRGFVEIDIRVNPQYSFTLMTAHLKSRRLSSHADEAELREQEAILFREKVDAFLQENPTANLIVLGDFNDTKDTPAIHTIRGRGRFALTDTRPAERNGDDVRVGNSRQEPMTVTWTHYFAREDTYSRIDYMFLSSGMVREWNRSETYVLATPNWGVASDHRPIVATFWAENR